MGSSGSGRPPARTGRTTTSQDRRKAGAAGAPSPSSRSRRTPPPAAGRSEAQNVTPLRRRQADPRTQAAPRPAPGRRTGPARPRPRPGSRPRPASRRRPALARLGSPRRRLRVSLLVLAFVLSLFVGRLMQLQGIDASAYVAQAEQKRITHRVLPATRGAITDRHGVALATTVSAVDITANPRFVTDPAATARLLAPILKTDAASLRSELADRNKGWVLLAKQQDAAVWDRIKELRTQRQGADAPARNLAAIAAEPHSKRVYPSGELAANIIGFVRDGHGQGGIEYRLDHQLSGRDGAQSYERAADGGGLQIPTEENTEHDAVPGDNVQLTIDRDLQWIAQQAIAKQVQKTGAESGTVVAMDPHTGQILAMATAPTFNPNDYAAASSANLGNRPLSEVYEPGSTGKIITMAAALEEKLVNPTTQVVVPPVLPRGGHTIHDDVSHGTWHLTLTGVLARSSNIGTVEVGERLGRDRLYRYLKLFGIAERTGLVFPGESAGILATPKDWSRVQYANIAFGQGYSLNAVQATAVYATIANGGVRVEPTLVKSVTSPDGHVTQAPAPTRTRVLSQHAAGQLATMLESVVSDEGTAPMAGIPGYRVAGKTGTAQRVDPELHRYSGYTSSFIGFAPADKPSLVVSVTLQRPLHGHFGGLLAGPVFKEVTSFALQTLKVPPTGTRPPRVPITW